jgi:hypothetical protein
MQRQVVRLESMLKKKGEQVRLLEELAKDLQREMSELRARFEGKAGTAAAEERVRAAAAVETKPAG